MTELEKLKALLDRDQVKLGVHIRKMNSPGTPVYRAIENVVPAGAILVAVWLAQQKQRVRTAPAPVPPV